MPETLEQKVNAPQEKKEEKPKETLIESVGSEIKQVSSGFVNSAIGATAIGAATALFGLDGLVTAASFPYGGMIEKRLMTEKDDSKRQFTSKNFRDESITGALLTPPVWYGIETVNRIPKALGLENAVADILGYSIPMSPLVVSGLFLGALAPAITALYYPLDYLVKNKTFKGMGSDFRKNYTKGLIRALPLTAVTSAVIGAASALPYLAPYLFPAIAVSNILYRLVLSRESLNYAKLLNPFTYVPKFLNPFYLVGGAANAAYKAAKNLFEPIYAIGSTLGEKISNLFKISPKPAASPAPQPV